MKKPFENKRVLITGGTGSLGKVLVHRLLSGEVGNPSKIIIFSRDEAKQHAMRVEFKYKRVVTEEVIYHNFEELLEFCIGDVRDFHDLSAILYEVDIVINAAALKQVPTCEYFPFQAVMTNICGAENIVRAICENRIPVETVVCVSTDKVCKSVNVMGMTKAIQERIFMQANMRCPKTRFIGVRYGNVLASRGSVIPLFIDQIKRGGPVTITTAEMTRFLISLNQAVDMIFDAVSNAYRGETYIPRIPSAKVTDLAAALIDKRNIKIKTIGIRPGEKIHEILISEEECHRTKERSKYYVIESILPELKHDKKIIPVLNKEYSSSENNVTVAELKTMLKKHRLTVEDVLNPEAELLR